MSKEVFPIRKSDLKRIRELLKEENKVVFKALLNIGVNTALRYSDLSNLKFEDINEDYTIHLREKKTKKLKKITLNKICRNEIKLLKKYYDEKNIEIKGYLFKSLHRKYTANNIDKNISIQSVNRWFKEVQDRLKIPYNIGTHSMRKTWGATYYNQTDDIGTLMYCLNHSNQKNTLKYIGITDEKIQQIFIKLLI